MEPKLLSPLPPLFDLSRIPLSLLEVLNGNPNNGLKETTKSQNGHQIWEKVLCTTDCVIGVWQDPRIYIS